MIDFCGYNFESGFILFADEFENVPCVFVVYTDKSLLEVGETNDLKQTLESSNHIKSWIDFSNSRDIYVAVYYEENENYRLEIKDTLVRNLSFLIR